MTWLSGKKTYIAAAASVIAAWLAVWAGSMDVGTAWQMTQTAILGSTIRHAVANS